MNAIPEQITFTTQRLTLQSSVFMQPGIISHMFCYSGLSKWMQSPNKLHSRSNVSTLQSSVFMKPGIISDMFRYSGLSKWMQSPNKFYIHNPTFQHSSLVSSSTRYNIRHDVIYDISYAKVPSNLPRPEWLKHAWYYTCLQWINKVFWLRFTFKQFPCKRNLTENS
jgi:hypothetical protein